MWIYNELKEENEDYWGDDNAIWTKEEIEECVESTRLNLYNRGLPCGPKAIRKNLDDFDHVKPLPSERTISRILAKRCLTHGRTGYYEGDR